uniref:Innexin n=1 Tax=Schistocephalus solidus TaxID=70667 RepID=A0A0X3Q237_SCHSO
MVASTFISYISKFKLTTYAGIEDFVDKFNFIFTVLIISLCTFTVAAKQYILKPISCYIATQVGGTNLLEYTENYCWVQGTLPISYAGKVPSSKEEWEQMEHHKILYYQWVPFVLGLQCILFYLPRVFWQMLCYRSSGTDLEHVINLSVQTSTSEASVRAGMITELASFVELMVFQQHKRASMRSTPRLLDTAPMKVNCSNIFDVSTSGPDGQLYKPAVLGLASSYCSRHHGNSLVSAYLLLKILYLLNSVGQIFLMQAFLGLPDAFGLLALRTILDGHDWQVTLVFPRVGFCYTPVRHLGSKSNAITAQCTLPVNMLNEKIYIFLWWWILLAIALNTLSLLIWLGRLCCRSVEAAYVVKYLSLADELEPHDERDAENFAIQFLRRDGMFLLRMIRLNAGDVVAAAVVSCLWNRYMARVKDAICDPLSNVRLPGKTAGFDKTCGSGDAEGENMKERLYPVADTTVKPTSSTPTKSSLENVV